jgi:archaetidylinositol phosphate synthase
MTNRSVTEMRRSNRGFLAGIEAPTLDWLAGRMPWWVTPDWLTGIGLLGAILAFGGYAWSSQYPQFLWLASFGLIVNWFGDSLDGSLARFRQIERARYGFYLDNSVDIFEQFLLAIGLGLSGILRIELALLGLAIFYAMSILTLIRARVFGEFSMDYGGLGPTELRVAFVILNLFVLLVPPEPFDVFGISLTYPNALSLTWITLTIITFFVVIIKDLRKLATEDPPRTN